MASGKFQPKLLLDRDSMIPLKVQICDQFRQEIIRNRLAEGIKLPSERQLAETLKLNRDTVHQAYEQLLSDGILEPVKSGSRIMVVSQKVAVSYRDRFPSINLILPHCFSEHLKKTGLRSLEIIAGIMDRAAELAISVNITLLPAANTSKKITKQWLETFFPRSIGILSLGLRSGEFDKVFEELLYCRILPHVFISGKSSFSHISSVTVDMEPGTKEMLAYLKKNGHSHLGIVAGRRNIPTQFMNCAFERGRVIGEMAQKFGFRTTEIEIDAADISRATHVTTYAEQILNLSPRPSVIWAQNDEFALQLKQAFISNGARIPDDFSLIGYDDIAQEEGLSSINHSRQKIGACAVDIVSNLFDNGSPGEAMHVTVPSFFVARRSIKTLL